MLFTNAAGGRAIAQRLWKVDAMRLLLLLCCTGRETSVNLVRTRRREQGTAYALCHCL